jgi:hypothetical protein
VHQGDRLFFSKNMFPTKSRIAWSVFSRTTIYNFSVDQERRNKMKKYVCIFVCALFVLTGVSSQAFAATMSQVAGTYQDVPAHVKIKVKKAGKDSDIVSGTLTITDTGTTTGSLVFDDGSGLPVPATCTLVKGKKLMCTLNARNLAISCAEWIAQLAASKGIAVYGYTIYWRLPVTTKIKVDKRTGRLKGKAKVKLKGWIEADTNLGNMSRKYNYQAKLVFP